MWASANQTSDHDLVNFTIKVESLHPKFLALALTCHRCQGRPGCRPQVSSLSPLAPLLSSSRSPILNSAVTSYGPIILGKIRIRAIKLDSAGELVPGEVEKDAHGKIQVETKHGKIDDDKLGFIFVRSVRIQIIVCWA
jgi:hypothetical protein